jgi:hypothetical protein
MPENLIVFKYGSNSKNLMSGCGLLKLAEFNKEQDRQQLVEGLGFKNGIIQVKDAFFSVIDGKIEEINFAVTENRNLLAKVFNDQPEYENAKEAVEKIGQNKYTISNHQQFRNIKCLFDSKHGPTIKALAQQFNILYQVDDGGIKTPVTSLEAQFLANLLIDKIFLPAQIHKEPYSEYLVAAITKFCEEKTLLEQNINGDTVLHAAIRAKNLGAIQQLVDKNLLTQAVLLKRNDKDQTAVELAQSIEQDKKEVKGISELLSKCRHFKDKIKQYTKTPIELKVTKIHEELRKKVVHLREYNHAAGADAIRCLVRKLESHLINYQYAECYRKQGSFDHQGFIDACKQELNELQRNSQAMKEINSPRGFSIQLLLAKIVEAFSSLFSNNKNAFFTSTGKLLTNLDEELSQPTVPRGQS